MRAPSPVRKQPRRPARATRAVVPGRAVALAGLAVATLLAFAGVARNAWLLYDDPEYVTANPLVRGGWSLASAWALLVGPHGANWHPLTSWSHLLDVSLFGLRAGPPHVVNLLQHVATAVLLAWTLHRATRAWWRSMLVAALWALHPLRVESVAWIAERKDVLSGLCFALALLAYVRWAERPTPARGAALAAAALAGLLAKPMLVTLPFVLVLLDVWPLGRAPGGERAPGVTAVPRGVAGLVLEKWPLLLLAAAVSAITFAVQRHQGTMQLMATLPFGLRAENACVAVWRYVGLVFWPARLAVFHPYPHAVAPAAALGALAALALVTAGALAQGRSRPYLAAGWLWFLGMLVPVIGLVQVGGQAYADRYTYLPSIGLLVAIVWALAEVAERLRVPRGALATATALVLGALALATARQVTRWHDTIALFRHTLAVTGPNAVAEQGIGNALVDSGAFAPGVAHLLAAERIDPTVPDLENTLGSALGMLGHYDEASVHFRRALAQFDKAETHHNLGVALAAAGRAAAAVTEFEAALRLDPGDRESLVRLGAALLDAGRPADAVGPLRRARELDPSDARIGPLLARAQAGAGAVAAPPAR